jgi:hypothetical protein
MWALYEERICQVDAMGVVIGAAFTVLQSVGPNKEGSYARKLVTA